MLNSSENCPVCQSDELRPFSHQGYELFYCFKCSLRFLSPAQKMKVNQAEMFTAPFEFWSTPDNYSKAQEIFYFYFENRLSLLRCFLKAKLRLLDVGCGHALWGRFLKDKGIDYEGIEPNVKTSDLMIHNSTFEEFSSSKKYNCLTLIDVLEHVHDPLSFLQKAHSLLEKDGLLYVQVPSVFGCKIPWGHEAGLPFHFWHFEYKSLKILLDRAGFELLHYETGILGVVGRKLKQGKIYWWQKILWKLSSFFKRGNRLQVLARARCLNEKLS